MNDEQNVAKRASAKRRIFDGLLAVVISLLAIFVYPIGLLGMMGDFYALSVLNIAFLGGIVVALYGVLRLIFLKAPSSK